MIVEPLSSSGAREAGRSTGLVTAFDELQHATKIGQFYGRSKSHPELGEVAAGVRVLGPEGRLGSRICDLRVVYRHSYWWPHDREGVATRATR